MSYEKLFTRYGSPSKEAEIRITGYLLHPSKLTLDRIPHEDQDAARIIAQCESTIKAMQEYRQALAARYAELDASPYTLRLELERYPYSSGIVYYVRLIRAYPDGTEVKEIDEHYQGKQRRQALARYEELKKQRPGIETVLDIERRTWER